MTDQNPFLEEQKAIRGEFEAAIDHAMDPETSPAQAISFAQSAARRVNDLAYRVREGK